MPHNLEETYESDLLRRNREKETALIGRLEAQGLIDRPTVPPARTDFRPLEISGSSLSETILEHRG
jgi:hypothetical protein